MIAVTALDRDGDYFSTFEVGFDAHLTKPIDYELIAAVISRVLSRPPPARRQGRHGSKRRGRR